MRAISMPDRREKRVNRTGRGARNLFDRWDEVSRRVRAANEIRLFMDFDGTLTAHAPYPDSVRLSDEMKAVLSKIVRHRRVHVGIVSGRRRATLQRLVRIPHVKFYGLYGWENGNRVDVTPMTAMLMREIIEEIEDPSSDLRGIQAEDKGASVAVHFREAPRASRRKAMQLIQRAVFQSSGGLRIVETESAWDAVPSDVRGKGAALQKLLRNFSDDFLPIYIGDDISDESAFVELRRGITVHVGPSRRTAAHYRLRDSDDVREFLKRLEKELR